MRCPKCGAELEGFETKCPNCGYVKIKMPWEVFSLFKKIGGWVNAPGQLRNSWLAAVLNFFGPGLGLIYIKTKACVVGGILLLVSVCAVWIFWLQKMLYYGHLILISVMIFSMVLGYVAAKHFNKKVTAAA